MPYVKFTTGHTGTAAIGKYLERDGRALAVDYINLDAPVVVVADGLEAYGAFELQGADEGPAEERMEEEDWMEEME